VVYLSDRRRTGILHFAVGLFWGFFVFGCCFGFIFGLGFEGLNVFRLMGCGKWGWVGWVLCIFVVLLSCLFSNT
jgi:hypothetical protein